MTFRTGKKHKAQETGKTGRNVLKLASRFQRFLNTGKSSKKDLKEIDDLFSMAVLDQGSSVLQLLDQLKDRIPKTDGKDAIDLTFENWTKWLASLKAKENLGYSSLRFLASEGETQSILIEGAIDAESDLFRSLHAFKSYLSVTVRKSAYEVSDSKEISTGAEEIFEAYRIKQRILGKMAAAS
ncbi:MAG: hypothetical protein OK439_05315 [Thaumarchaeota archaeon]|nr:hypothetical protein [Nitrososphaerota archaeon]